jgi:hypothetical protein
MQISKSLKAKLAAFLALWFSGQLNDLEAFASALEELAAEARRQASTVSASVPGGSSGNPPAI